MLLAEERSLVLQASSKRAKAEGLEHWLQTMAVRHQKQLQTAGQKRLPAQEATAPAPAVQSDRTASQSAGGSASQAAKKQKSDKNVSELPNAFKLNKGKDVMGRKMIKARPNDMPFTDSGARIKAAEVRTANSSKWVFCAVDIATAYFQTKQTYHTVDILKQFEPTKSGQPRVYLLNSFDEDLKWMGGHQTVYCDPSTIFEFVVHVVNKKKGVPFTTKNWWILERFRTFLVKEVMSIGF